MERELTRWQIENSDAYSTLTADEQALLEDIRRRGDLGPLMAAGTQRYARTEYFARLWVLVVAKRRPAAMNN